MRTLGEKLLVLQADSRQNRQIDFGFGFPKKGVEIFEYTESESDDSSNAAVRGFTSMVGDMHKNRSLGKNRVCAGGRISWSEMATGREHQFSPGDFVWGKIGTQLYWPGRVYAPSDASDYAAKFKLGDHILVAFYDGKFSWCDPSQLEPFVENFDLMFNQSNSKTFVNAVEDAVDEISSLLELQMTCSCAPKRAKFRALTSSSAIKKEVFVPLDGAGKLSIASYESTLLVTDIRDLAQNVSANGVLELTMLKSWLSAFYWAKGCYQLPVYQEPQAITELEGNNMNSLNLIDGGGHIGGPIQAQMDDLWVSLPTVPKYGQTDQLLPLSSGQQHLKVSEDELYQRRKQKSVAELMGEEVDIEPENMWAHMSNVGTLVGSNFPVSTSEKIKESGELGSQIDNLLISPLGRKRGRKPKLQAPAIRTDNQEAYVKNGELGSHSGDQLISPLGRKRGRKPKPKFQGPITTENHYGHVENGELGSNSSYQLSSPSGRKRGRKPKLQDPPVVTENQLGFVEDVELRNHSAIQMTSPFGKKRGRKPKLQNPLISTENQDTCIENSELGSHSGIQLTSSLGRKRGRKPKLQVSSIVTENQDSVLQHDGSKVIEGNYESSSTIGKTVDREDKFEIKRGLLSRKRKRSKYLSPPYTADVIEMLAHSSLNSDSETECNEASNVDQNELQIQPGDPIMGFSPVSECGGKTCEINTFNRLGDGHALLEDSSFQPLKQEKVVIVDMKDVQASPYEFLVELQYAAISLQDSMAGKKLDLVNSFFALFRSSMYSDGSNYQLYHKRRRGRKRKSDLEPGSVGRTHIQTLDHIHKSEGAANLQTKGEARLDVSKLKRAPVASDGKTIDDHDGIVSSPALFVSFPPVFSIPTKENLIAMYSKFGALIETETDILHNSFSARVVFARTGDAERAFNESVKNSPFGAAKVTFRLRYPSGFPRVQDVNGNSNMGAPSLPGEGNWPLESPSSIQLNFIEKKLKIMTAMVKSADGNLSQEMKSTLEHEMKSLLEKVRTMEVSTSS